MIIRQRLLAEMMALIAETKLDDQLQEIITQILEIKPNNPYLFLQKKMQQKSEYRSLKQKMDNSKTSQYLLQITMYLTHIDPITNPQNLIKDKIISIYV